MKSVSLICMILLSLSLKSETKSETRSWARGSGLFFTSYTGKGEEGVENGGVGWGGGQTNREVRVVDLHDLVVVEPEVGDGERHGLGHVGQAAVGEVHQLQHLAAERQVRHRHQRVLVQEQVPAGVTESGRENLWVFHSRDEHASPVFSPIHHHFPLHKAPRTFALCSVWVVFTHVMSKPCF